MVDKYVILDRGGSVVATGSFREIFPGVKPAASGPDAAFLTNRNAYLLHGAPSYDPETHKPVSTAPYLDGDMWRNETLASLTEQEIADRLDTYKQNKRAALRSKFSQERDKGTLINDNLISTTHQARLELAALVENLTVNGGTQKGVTRSGKRIIFDLSTATAALAAVDAHHAICNATEYDLDAEIDAATTKEELEAIDLSVGWPE